MAVYFIEEIYFLALKWIYIKAYKAKYTLKNKLVFTKLFILRILNSKANIRMTIKRKSEGDGSQRLL